MDSTNSNDKVNISPIVQANRYQQA